MYYGNTSIISQVPTLCLTGLGGTVLSLWLIWLYVFHIAIYASITFKERILGLPYYTKFGKSIIFQAMPLIFSFLKIASIFKPLKNLES